MGKEGSVLITKKWLLSIACLSLTLLLSAQNGLRGIANLSRQNSLYGRTYSVSLPAIPTSQ